MAKTLNHTLRDSVVRSRDEPESILNGVLSSVRRPARAGIRQAVSDWIAIGGPPARAGGDTSSRERLDRHRRSAGPRGRGYVKP